MQKFVQLIVTKLTVDGEHYHNSTGILKLDFGLIAVVILTSHVPNIKLDLSFDVIHFYIHQFLIIGRASSWGFVSTEASMNKLVYYTCFTHVIAANKNNLSLWNGANGLLNNLLWGLL